ncbi:RDD family protein [Falsibacillus pallidus]|uniref:Putative RDD family membrane protein YckC n=1 Tax=Falsibacillus pallidus TaxID=493781 RepID=A0A370GQI9_9BACI|nr:RDD family protein [Falsibacillus pallidus]RDI45771.1 putative RDD family membrane protein YckC [Falsibacillus pallidus]
MVRPAGFWIRLGATLLDGLIVSTPLGLIISFLFYQDFQTNHPLNNLTLLYDLITPVLWSGYVVGKRIVGIRIVKVDGSNVTIWTMLLRIVVAGLVYVVTLGIGVIVSAIMVGVRDDKRSIHDFIAGTYVTYAKPGEMKPVEL